MLAKLSLRTVALGLLASSALVPTAAAAQAQELSVEERLDRLEGMMAQLLGRLDAQDAMNEDQQAEIAATAEMVMAEAQAMRNQQAELSAQVGDVVEAMPPLGNFYAETDAEAPHYLGFAGGSGITPLLSILRTGLEREPLARFTLVYANRNPNTIMFRE